MKLGQRVRIVGMLLAMRRDRMVVLEVVHDLVLEEVTRLSGGRRQGHLGSLIVQSSRPGKNSIVRHLKGRYCIILL